MPPPPWLNVAAERSDPFHTDFLLPCMSQPDPQDASGKNSPKNRDWIPGIWLRVIAATEAGLRIRTSPYRPRLRNIWPNLARSVAVEYTPPAAPGRSWASRLLRLAAKGAPVGRLTTRCCLDSGTT